MRPGRATATHVLAPHDDGRFREAALLDQYRSRADGSWRVVVRYSTGAGLTYVRACLCEAMRLWPTTPLLSRETLVELSWRGARVPAGTQILIFNTFHHRDRERLAYADRFAPEEWIDGSAGEDWGLNFFSHGPQGCPGAGLSLLIGAAVIAELLGVDLRDGLIVELEPDGLLNPER